MKNKYVASTLALTLGIYGVHRFYLGQKFRGVIQFGVGVFALMITVFEHEPLIIVPALVAFIEAVLLLVMPKEDFNEKHNKKYQAFTRPRQQAFYQRSPEREQEYDDEYDDYEEEAPPRRSRSRQAPTRRRNVNPYKSSGVAKFNDYDYDGAILDFKKALRHKYNDPSLHFNLACCYSINEHSSEAFFHLDKAISFGFVDFDKIQKHNSLAFVRTEDEFEDFVRNGYRLKPVASSPMPDDFVEPFKTQAAATSPPVKENDLLEQIIKLGDLREKGILTEEEFQMQKQKLMRDD